MTREQVLNLYFLDARAKLIDLAAFLDRVERSSGEDDFRIRSFRAALRHLSEADPEKARAVLTTLSDPTMEPLETATTKGAPWAHGRTSQTDALHPLSYWSVSISHRETGLDGKNLAVRDRIVALAD